MPDLQGKIGELRFTIEVTRKETGKVETYELIGHVMNDEEETEKGNEDGSNS